VSGRISLDGKPIRHGAIRFVPIDGETATAGAEIKDGQYTITVPVNKCKVTINAADDASPGKLTQDSMTSELPLPPDLIPAKYNVRTELVFDVQEGQNQKDFQLTSR
jgi:hypothetical protein